MLFQKRAVRNKLDIYVLIVELYLIMSMSEVTDKLHHIMSEVTDKLYHIISEVTDKLDLIMSEVTDKLYLIMSEVTDNSPSDIDIMR
jgi:hypothetical protein